MRDDVRELFKTYFGRSPEWVDQFTPGMSNAPILLGTDINVGEGIADFFTKRVVAPGTHYDIPLLQKYIDDPSKCVKYPFVANMARQINITDEPWIEDLIRNRTPKFDEVSKILREAGEELSHPTPCYSRWEIAKFTKALIEAQL